MVKRISPPSRKTAGQAVPRRRNDKERPMPVADRHSKEKFNPKSLFTKTRTGT